MTNLRYPGTHVLSKNLFTLKSITINKQTHTVFLSIVRYKTMIKCEHCDVDAYYRLTIEDFNSAEADRADLCIKCIKIEALKAIGDIPAIKSLKVEPLFSTLTASTPISGKL